jgi:hypothetical protein
MFCGFSSDISGDYLCFIVLHPDPFSAEGNQMYGSDRYWGLDAADYDNYFTHGGH